MLATFSHFVDDFLMCGVKEYRKIMFHITKRCNAMCAHCSYSSDDTHSEILPFEWFKKAVDETTHIDMPFTSQGGEIFLYPEYCKNMADYWRETQRPDLPKRQFINMMTNGFWGNDKSAIDYVKNEIKPNLIGISVDKFHQNFVPIESVNNIIKAFEDDPEIYLFFVQSVTQENPAVQPNFFLKPEFDKYKEILGLEFSGNQKPLIWPNGLSRVGRAADNNFTETPVRKHSENKLLCDCLGINIHANGDIGLECPIYIGCTLGHIEKDNLGEIYKNLFTLSKYTLETNPEAAITVTNMAEICGNSGKIGNSFMARQYKEKFKC